ncbi:hypothetical protein COCCADRAFT_29558 [Bipolaris zeicola 26-R-13]|uniref:Haloacid dehalogenase n=1 Tax=Cochliobolus carbonum (strain 26-R-13) TaxID=930089 RepID=W6XPR6_COCC2|nr:uncharacterized protein COCCADRAFT_29558 [Bipolaris zeicola 26-R-13]EUC29362.1 hypothetical protein COCCADRAFT_29558 [Bipolaris zeicola 26-R-13]
MALSPTPRALLFDVFGTCVNWRKSVVSALCDKAHESLNAATASLASQLRLRASAMTEEDWGRFAQEWRDSYKVFTQKLAADHSSTWMTVDDHHLKSLKELIAKWELQGLWDEHEIRALSLCWHHLVPWDDSVLGVQLLNQLFATCTLSNGNMSLLSDLRAFTAIPFTHLFSSEMFGTYKPSPEVYLGAVKALGVAPAECVMVAAHLNDLKAAKENGLQTIYVERIGEEDWGDEEIKKARTADWVDMWVGLGDGNRGFITVAEKLGIAVTEGYKATRLSSSLPIGMD